MRVNSYTLGVGAKTLLWATGKRDEQSVEGSCPPLFVMEECVVSTAWYDMVGYGEECECRPSYPLLTLFFSLLAFLMVWFGAAKLQRWILMWTRAQFKSWFVSVLVYWSKQPRFKAASVRSVFASMPHPATTAAANHTHPESAKNRSTGSSEMTYLAQALGVQPYYLQQSRADQKLERAGSREYFWAKDLAAKRVCEEPNPDLMAIVDVDYYINMPMLLATHCVPVVMYTFVPRGVSSDKGEYSYTFTESDEIKYTVSGGACYQHALWSYSADVIVATTTWFGFWKVSVTYNVDRRQIDRDHQMILLTPIARTSCPFLSLSSLVECTPLARLRVVQAVDCGDGKVELFTRLDVKDDKTLMRSTGRPNSYASATIPASVDDTLSAQSSLGKLDLTLAQVKVTTGNEDMTSAAVLTQYHRLATPIKTDTVFPVSEAVRTFAFAPEAYDGEVKPACTAFMSPLSLGALVPAVCAGNDTQAIRGRVEGVLSKQLELKPKMLGYMDEFVKLLIPDNMAHKGVPVDYEEVYARQNRPTQRRLLEEASSLGGLSDKCPVSMMKKESYAKVTDPRNITIIPAQNKLKFSTYMYAFSEYLRTKDWYAFGKTPLEIARRVGSICATAKSVVKTDLSRCDGRISNLFRHLEKMIMLRYFVDSEGPALVEVMETQYQKRAYTATGLGYDTGDSRLSGSPETADFNSFDNAFIAYTTYREQGLTPAEAYDKLGIYGGDDGLSADIDPKLYERSASDLGQVLEAEQVMRDCRGVDFLSRLYSSRIWSGDLDSMCDVKRQVIKLHLSANLPPGVESIDKLREKMRGFLAMDRNTPVIGELAVLVDDAFGQFDTRPELRGVANYYADFDSDDQYPNEDTEDWMTDELQVNFPAFDRPRFTKWCHTVREFAKQATPVEISARLLAPPLCCEEEAPTNSTPAPVVVGGDLVKPSEKQAAAPAEQKDGEVCQFYLAGKCSWGKKCKRLHPGDIPQDKVECADFKKGKCKAAPGKCKYVHTAVVPPNGRPGS